MGGDAKVVYIQKLKKQTHVSEGARDPKTQASSEPLEPFWNLKPLRQDDLNPERPFSLLGCKEVKVRLS